jgi:Ca2+/H+ antiporter
LDWGNSKVLAEELHIKNNGGRAVLMLNILLIFLPVTLFLEFVYPQYHGLIFVTSALAIIPLAA